MKEKDAAKNKGKMMPAMAMGFVSMLVMSFVMSNFVASAGAKDAASGAMVGFLAWFGFVATILGGAVIWEGKSLDYYMVNAGHYLVTLALLGAINAVVM